MASLAGVGSERFPRLRSLRTLIARPGSPRSAPSRKVDNQQNEITNLIEGEIIPRLLSAHVSDTAADRRVSAVALLPAEVSRFAPLAMHLEADELLVEVEAFLQRGVSAESIFVDLLAPSARKLGQMWEEDSCDFVDVTMGLWRLQEVMREVAIRSPATGMTTEPVRTALFTPMPGEQHSFGSLMIEEVFARAGWQSEVLIEPDRAQLLKLVAERSFDLIGITVSCDCTCDVLANLITALRSVSIEPRVQILIGGRMINANPDLLGLVGADGTAPDATSALRLAEGLVQKSRHLDYLAK